MAFNTKKFGKIMSAVGYLPANAFSGLTNLLLGSTSVDEKTGEPVVKPGLLGLALNGIKFVARSTADFIAEHKKAIATAAWLSLAGAGAVALTLFLWPAALAAVASFSIYGFSIAGVVGANTLAQIGLAAGLAAAATSAVTYAGAAVGNFISWVAGCCKNLRSKSAKPTTGLSKDEEDLSDEENNYSSDEEENDLLSKKDAPSEKNTGNPMSGLMVGGTKNESTNVVTLQPPVQFSSPLTSVPVQTDTLRKSTEEQHDVRLDGTTNTL